MAGGFFKFVVSPYFSAPPVKRKISACPATSIAQRPQLSYDFSMEVGEVRRLLCLALFVAVILLAFSREPASTKAYVELAAFVLEEQHDLMPLQAQSVGTRKALLLPDIEEFEEDRWNLSKFITVTDEEFSYLLSLQDENGIIAQTPARDTAIPYFANMAALAMLSREEGLVPVHRYMDWYISHLNQPDRFKMPGTIYDYRKQGGKWVPTYDYDSADSYAATFLTLALSYTRVSGSIEYANQNLQNIVDIAEVLVRLQDRDGLIWAKPGYMVKFLMDNAENYRGLMDAAALMSYLERHELSQRYREAAERVKEGMESRLWSEERGTYAWALYGRYWRRAPRRKWYPDTIGQVYPIVFGVLDPHSERARHLYAYLNQQYPNWTAGQFDDRFPWTVLALVATLMEDDARAVGYLESVLTQVQEHRRGYPWHAFESAFFIKAWERLGLRYAPVVANVDEEEPQEDTRDGSEEDQDAEVQVEDAPGPK
jgi:hypothetical protein